MTLMTKMVPQSNIILYQYIIRVSNRPLLIPSVAYSSGKCGSDKKDSKSSKSQGGEGDVCDPCDPWSWCPCSGDSPCPPAPSPMYESRKYGHSLPPNDVITMFEPLPNIPTGVFRKTDGETLGLGAGKCCFYKNPEYFSFHHMSYYDMHLIMRSYRKPSPNTHRKP